MKFKDSGNGGGTFAQAPAGTHVARCIKMIDLGTQTGEYKGEKTVRRQVLISWELPNELMPDGEFKGKPFSVSKFYTQSLNEKASLRKDLENWRGKAFSADELQGFDAKNILGKGCMVSITLSESGKSKVSGVMALPKGTQVPPQVNPSVLFSLEEFDKKVFDGISEGIKKIIMLSPEYQKLAGHGFEDIYNDLPWQDDSEDAPF